MFLFIQDIVSNILPEVSFLEGFLRPAAYLDPGSGSVLLQVLLAALLAAGFLIRAFWGRITSFFKRSSESEEIEEEEV